MGLVSSSDIEFGLYLSFSGPVPHREEKICSSTIECSHFLSLQNLGGVNRTLQLKSPKLMDPMALMEVNLNFTKVHLEDAYLSNLAKFKDIEAIIERVRSRELTIQLSHLLVLRSDCCHSNQPTKEVSGRFSIEDTAQQMTAASTGPKVYFLMVRVGNMCLESTLAIDPTESDEYKLSETAHPVLRIKLNQKKHKSLLVVSFKEFLTDQTLEALFQKYMGCTDDVPNLVDFVITNLPDLEMGKDQPHTLIVLHNDTL